MLSRSGLLWKRRFLKFLGRPVLEQLWIGVTYVCQCRCIHCGVCTNKTYNATEAELGTEEIKGLISAARSLSIPKVALFGGEPLLRDDIVDVVSFASSSGLKSVIYTNGILLDRKTVRALKEAGLTKCNVSLDSSFKEEHDRRRGYRGCFEKAVKGIRCAIDEGLRCSIWTYASKNDVRNNDMADLRGLIRLARDLGVYNIMILFPAAAGNWQGMPEVLLTMEEREKVRSLYNPPFVIMEFPREDTRGTGGRSFVYITPYGDVTPCPFLQDSYGNVRDVTLKEALRRLRSERTPVTVCGSGQCMMNRMEVPLCWTAECAGTDNGARLRDTRRELLP